MTLSSPGRRLKEEEEEDLSLYSQDTPPGGASRSYGEDTCPSACNFNITVSPRRPPRSRPAAAPTDLPHVVKVVQKNKSTLHDIKKRIRSNEALLHEKTEERKKLNELIDNTTKENARLGADLVGLVEVEKSKNRELEKKNAELSNARVGIQSLKQNFGIMNENMLIMAKKFEKMEMGD